MDNFKFLLLWMFIVSAVVTCERRKEVAMKIELTSPAFSEGGTIPRKYTCDGDDLSPPLVWRNVPQGTESIALICDDPDAPMGTWVHWVMYDIPPTASGLPEGVPAVETLPDGSKQGINDFKRIGYGGPCPPPGRPHRYFFRIYALDTVPGLGPGATKDALLRSMEGHILAQGQLMGRYGR